MTVKELKESLNPLPEHFEVKVLVMESNLELKILDTIQGMDEDNEPQNIALVVVDI